MDKILMSTVYSFLLMALASSKSTKQKVFGPPRVTLNCSADYVTLKKIVEVSWKPTLVINETFNATFDDRIQDCKANITCNVNKTERDGCDNMDYNNITDTYPKWKFSIPFYETLCSVKVYYEDYDLIDKTYQTSVNCLYLAPISGIFMKGSAGNMTMGKPYSIQCSIEMSERVDSSIIKIDWSDPDGSIITNDNRINIHPTVSVDGIIHNSTLQFLYLSQNDSGSFVCNVTLVDTTLSQIFELENITNPISAIFMKGSTGSVTMGKPYSIQCIVKMSEKVDSSIIKIDWSGPDGSIITNDSRINIHPTVSVDGIIHNSTLQFLYLSQNDSGSFVCNVTLVDTTLSQTFELENVTTPITKVFVQGSTNSVTMGNPYSIQCSVEMSEKINSNIVIFDWSGPHGSITNESRVTIHPTVVSNNSIIYTSILQFFYLDHSDNGSFICSVTVFDTSLSQTYKLDNIAIPIPNVTVTAFNDQKFNNSMSLECIITTVRGIILEMVWMANDTIIKRTDDSSGNIVNKSVIYRDVYDAPSNMGYKNTEYYCHGVVNGIAVANGSFMPPGIEPSPASSTSSTASTITTDSIINSTATGFIINSTVTGLTQVAIIISFITGFLFISLLIGIFVYKCRRRLHLKRTYSTNNNVQFRALSISEVDYSVSGSYKDNASICENQEINDVVVGWIKTMQEPDLDEQHDDICLSNEDILNYICGQNLNDCNPGQINESMKYKEIPKPDEDLNTSGNNIEEALNPSVNHNCIKSAVQLDKKCLNDNSIFQQNNHDVQDFEKNSNQSIQEAEDNSEEAHTFSTAESPNKLYATLKTNAKSVPDKIYIEHNTTCHWYPLQDKSISSHQCSSIALPIVNQSKYDNALQESFSHQNNTNREILHTCNDENTSKTEMVAAFDQFSSDSSDKPTEDTLTTSVSSYDANSSLAEGDYVENTSSTNSSIDDVICIPMQSHNLHPNIVTPLDDEMCLPTTAIEGEYVDSNIAVQHNKHTVVYTHKMKNRM